MIILSIYRQYLLTMPTSTENAPTEPQQRLGFLLYRAGLAVSRGYERALKPIDVAPVEAGVLSALCYSGPNHVRGLARLLGVGRQTIVNTTKSLELRSFIVRKISGEDARLATFTIASAGKRKLKQVEIIAQTFDQELRLIVGANYEPVLIQKLAGIVDSPLLAYEV
jgi:DNA-binding MarR family transcriptional regulator